MQKILVIKAVSVNLHNEAGSEGPPPEKKKKKEYYLLRFTHFAHAFIIFPAT